MRRHPNPFIAAAIAAAAMLASPAMRMERIRRSARRRMYRALGIGQTYKPNGKRECARRRRQIASGQLTESNGLVRGQA